MKLQQPLAQQVAAVQGDWAPLLRAWAASEAGRSLMARVDARVAAGATVYPPQVFRSLQATPLARTRVLILGQDPYHGPGQAEGLAFSVPVGQRVPPSLRNILAELQRDLGLPPPPHGHLGAWAAQGVLLLNTTLTVEDGSPASHAKYGWEVLTDLLISVAAQEAAPKVFMLWGAHAQAKAARVREAGGAHLLLQCNHPSPLAARRAPLPFIGCGHFGQAQAFLAAVRPQEPPLDWTLPQ